MSTKRRKPGDWKKIAEGRSKEPRILHNGVGVTNIPKPGETGSAKYRRLVKRSKSGK